MLGNRTVLTNTANRVTRFEYDTLNRLITTTRYLTGVPIREVTHYDALGNRVATIDARGQATTYGYDTLGHTIAITDANLHVITFAYDVLGRRTAQTDALQHTTVYTPDRLGRQIATADPLGYLTQFGYDVSGNRVGLTDANGLVTRYEYDTLDRLSTVIENYTGGLQTADRDVRTTYAYDALGNRTVITNARGYTTTYTYDALSRMTTQTDSLGHQTAQAYDAVGNRTVLTDANGQTTTYTYDVLNRNTRINYGANTTTFEYDALGNRKAMTDSLGVTRYEYDELNRLTQVTDPFTGTVQYRYDAVGNRTQLIYPDSKVITYTFDAANRLTGTLSWDGQLTTYAFDPAERLITTTLPPPGSVQTIYIYDDANRTTRLTHSRSGAMLADYQFVLDKIGNRLIVTETLGRPSTTILTGTSVFTIASSSDDAHVDRRFAQIYLDRESVNMGQPGQSIYWGGYRFAAVTLPSGSQILSGELRLRAYAAASTAASLNIYRETNANPASYSTYADFIGRSLSSSPVVWSVGSWTAGQDYGKDITPLFTALQHANGNALAFQIDASGYRQAQAIDMKNGTPARLIITYTYPVSSVQLVTTTIHYTYDPLSRLTEADFSSGDYFAYTYDAVGNRTSELKRLAAQPMTNLITQTALYTIRASSDDSLCRDYGTIIGCNPQFPTMRLERAADHESYNAFRFASVALPQDAQVINSVLRLTSANSGGGGVNFRIYGEAADEAEPYEDGGPGMIFYDRDLTTGSIAWSPETWPAALEEHEVDVTRVVTEVTARPGWKRGNPVAVQVHSESGIGERFAYSVDGSPTHAAQLQVTYTITNMQLTTYTYDAANRLSSVNTLPGAGVQTYTWDNNGNLINDGSVTYLYDRANRMISTTLGGVTSLYAYNGDGARLRQVIAGVPTTYTQDLVAPLPVVLQARTGTATTPYLYAIGTRPLAQYTSGSAEYLLPDALGSVRQIVDANGNVTLAESYEPYGSVLTSTGTASSIFAYAGEQIDTYIKLLFLRARYYSPETARFLSKDVWQGDYTRPQSLNGWAYVEGEPVNHTDPSGQWALDLSNQKVYLVAEEGDSWDSYLAGFYGKEVTVATLSSWLHLDLRLSPPRTGTKINITSALDPLIAKVAELGGGMEQRYYPPNVRPFNCYPTALTCAADECQYREYMGYDIDDFLRDNSHNVEYEEDLRYGDIFRIGGQDDGKREDGSPAFYNAPIHYGMILWRSGTTGKIWTFNGQITSYAFIAQLPDVLAYYRTEYPERDIRGVPKPEDFRGDFGPMHPTGFYRLNLSVSAAQIVQWIDDPNKTPSSK